MPVSTWQDRDNLRIGDWVCQYSENFMAYKHICSNMNGCFKYSREEKCIVCNEPVPEEVILLFKLQKKTWNEHMQRQVNNGTSFAHAMKIHRENKAKPPKGS